MHFVIETVPFRNPTFRLEIAVCNRLIEPLSDSCYIDYSKYDSCDAPEVHASTFHWMDDLKYSMLFESHLAKPLVTFVLSSSFLIIALVLLVFIFIVVVGGGGGGGGGARGHTHAPAAGAGAGTTIISIS
jgi:hypothetical protein